MIFFLKNCIEFNFLFFIFSLILSIIVYYFSKKNNFLNLIKNFDNVFVLRLILLCTLLISFFIFFLSFLVFLKFYQSLVYVYLFNNFNFIYNDILFLKIPIFLNIFNKFSIEFFGFIFIILAYIVGFLSFLALDTRLFWKNIKFIFICNLLVLIIYLYTVVNDVLLLFILYECMLIPSFLFVYFVSPYKRGIQASLYFLIWTQLGSLLVLSSTAYVIYTTGHTSFLNLKNFIFTSDENWWIYFFLFFGFGFKVPIWPFQYWLTKTHVEAPAGFSIYLSGFLVKTAIYGFFKLTNELLVEVDTFFFSIFAIMGVIDASIKMWGQLDLKKLVAYGTVQEMNLLYIAFLWGDTGLYISGVLFCVTHAFLSSMMFYIVDCIQRRYNTRIISELSGILHITPNLGIMVILMQIFYSGLPGTLKFISEFYLFSGLINFSFISVFLLLFVANFLGLIGFSKCWFNILFGLNLKFKNNILIDLTLKEIFFFCICFFSLLFFGLIFNINV